MTIKSHKELTQKILRFLRGDHTIAKRLRHLSAGAWRTYLFGGTVREILIGSEDAQIRDLDIVIDDAGFPAFCKQFERSIHGTNRFGGTKLILDYIPVDAWALGSTWAFASGNVREAKVPGLLETTFLNVDAVVFEITPGRVRNRLLGGPFIKALNANLLDIVLQENPCPALAAVRTIRMYMRYNMPMSRRLAHYVFRYLESEGIDACLSEQIRHYRRVVVTSTQLEALRERLGNFIATKNDRMPEMFQQLDLACGR